MGTWKIEPRRGEVYLVAFDPVVGSEVGKIRPALVVQNDEGNRYSQTTIVAAITSCTDESLYPFEVFLQKGQAGLHNDSIATMSQIRAVDKSRLGRKLGVLDSEYMRAVDRALRISLDLVDI